MRRAAINNEDYIRLLKSQRADRVPRPHGLPVIADSDDKGNFSTPVHIPSLLLEAGCQSYFQRAYPALPSVENTSEDSDKIQI